PRHITQRYPQPLSTRPTPAHPHTPPLSLHDALPILVAAAGRAVDVHRQTQTPRFRHDVTEDEILKRRVLRHRRDAAGAVLVVERSEEHTSELQSRFDLVCRLLLEKKNK